MTATKKLMTFKCTCDGFWGVRWLEANPEVTIRAFSLESNNHVIVYHDGPWWVYTDTGFRDAAREYTGIADLHFTEQGMQADGEASMEYTELSYAS